MDTQQPREFLISRLVGWIGVVFASISSLLMLALVFIVTYNVFLRYVLRTPSSTLNEWAAYLFVPIVAFGLADTQRERGHVAVEFLLAAVPRRVRATMFVITTAVTGLYALLYTWATYRLAHEAYSDGLHTIIARIPLGVVQFTVTIGFALFVAQAVVDCFRGEGEILEPHSLERAQREL